MEDSERKSGEGTWLVTYSDLVTLLLVFFVLLYVLAPGIDQSTFNDFISHFQASTSIVFENDESRTQQEEDSFRKEWDEIMKYLENEGLTSEVMLEKIDRGVKLTLSDSLTFNSGSDRLLVGAKGLLRKVGSILGSDVESVKTQGHTDNVPIADSSQFRSNWHLGAARAVSVLRFMAQESSLEPEKFEASSFGKYRPVTSNKTMEGRRRNRRVEIYIIYREKMPWPTIQEASAKLKEPDQSN